MNHLEYDNDHQGDTIVITPNQDSPQEAPQDYRFFKYIKWAGIAVGVGVILYYLYNNMSPPSDASESSKINLLLFNKLNKICNKQGELETSITSLVDELASKLDSGIDNQDLISQVIDLNITVKGECNDMLNECLYVPNPLPCRANMIMSQAEKLIECLVYFTCVMKATQDHYRRLLSPRDPNIDPLEQTTDSLPGNSNNSIETVAPSEVSETTVIELEPYETIIARPTPLEDDYDSDFSDILNNTDVLEDQEVFYDAMEHLTTFDYPVSIETQTDNLDSESLLAKQLKDMVDHIFSGDYAEFSQVTIILYSIIGPVLCLYGVNYLVEKLRECFINSSTTQINGSASTSEIRGDLPSSIPQTGDMASTSEIRVDLPSSTPQTSEMASNHPEWDDLRNQYQFHRYQLWYGWF